MTHHGDPPIESFKQILNIAFLQRCQSALLHQAVQDRGDWNVGAHSDIEPLQVATVGTYFLAIDHRGTGEIIHIGDIVSPIVATAAICGFEEDLDVEWVATKCKPAELSIRPSRY